MNTCPSKRTPAGRSAWLALLCGGLIILGAFTSGFALDPYRAMTQYARDYWGFEKGFSGGTVYAIAQTPDGYLWIGSEKGLYRFDGLQFVSVRLENKALLTAEPVLGLVTDREGSLWIRLRHPKVVRYRDGRFEDALVNLKEVDPRISSMSRADRGDLLVSTLENGPLRYDGQEFVPLVPKAELPSSFVTSAAVTESGEVWMGTREAGLYRFGGQRSAAVTVNLPDRKINYLLADGQRRLWVGTDRGVALWSGESLSVPELPEKVKNGQILTMLKDRDANVWLGTESHGLVRIDARGEVEAEKEPNAATNIVTALFEDREGNLWVGSQSGLERLRDNVFVTYSVDQGLPSDSSGALHVDVGLNLWFAPTAGGLYRLENNRVRHIAAAGIERDVVYSIAGDGAGLWVGRQRGGLTHLQFTDSSTEPVVRRYTTADGLAQDTVYTVFRGRDASVWAGTLSGGVSRFKDGRFVTYTTADGLASNSVNAIAESPDGTIWLATAGGLSAFADDVWRSFAGGEGLPAGGVNCLAPTASGDGLWLGTAKGLGLFGEGRFRLLANVPGLAAEPVLGLAEDKNGFLWISTADRVLRLEVAKLNGDSLAGAAVREFGPADGLLGIEGIKRSQNVQVDAFGKIWFLLNRGISMIDPQRVGENSFPAVVRINQLAADGAPVDGQHKVRLAAGYQRLTIGYSGLSLGAPERVRFRYKLDGFDDKWSEPTSSREAVYTNLGPGSYTFRVVAANGDGLWNSNEAVIEFAVEPRLWQTWWFALLCLLLLFLLIALVFRVRMYRLTRNLNRRFEERLAERTMIARELHDSLLQGVVGASMQLTVALDQLPESVPARQSLAKAVKSMTRVINEGRNTVRGLRTPVSENVFPLEQSFSKMWQNLSFHDEREFKMIVDGEPLALRPLVRDEVYRIGSEALTNAFRHSGADKVVLEINYAGRYFKLLVRDNGRGIDPQILRAGREGHWGLVGMRERANGIGARFKVMSRVDGGTEVELTVPARIAFPGASPNNRLTAWWNRFFKRGADLDDWEGK